MRRPAWFTTGILATVLIAACGSGDRPVTGDSSDPAATPSAPRASSAMPPPSGADAPTPSPTFAATPTRVPEVTMAPTATGGSSDVLVGSVVTTLADEGLRVRSKPRINEDSIKLQPLLPLGAQLLVLQGPVTASGYEWYEVAPMTSRGETGWVARADRDGTPWIEDDEFDCPAPPRDIASLAALPPGVGLACFPRQPITVKARLLSCNCDMDGSSYSPTWFFLGSGSPELLVEPGQRDVPRDTESWFHLNLDPEGEHPAVLPVDRLVEVTGIFDHPAAAGCTETEMDGQPVASTGCRLRFAVTRLTAAAP